jgi:catechol 2,3-dioxygenase-like lactoylglutathione lyase family enzyme
VRNLQYLLVFPKMGQILPLHTANPGVGTKLVTVHQVSQTLGVFTRGQHPISASCPGPKNVFKKGASRAIQSPHDGDGELHVAFSIPSAELTNWESWLQTRGIEVEEKWKWDLEGWSLYFRDPDRHLIELATPGTWSVY